MNITQSRIVPLMVSAALIAGAVGMGSIASIASAQAGGPTVMLTSTASSTTNTSPLPVTATFSSDVSGFTSSDVTVASGTVSNFATTSASVYTFDVTPTAQGTVTVNVAADMATNASSTGNQASNTLTFTFDTTAPVISGVSVATTTTTATITWNTNEAATGNVAYGTTTAYGSSSTLEVTASTTHAAALTGLSPSTTYHYRITQTDAAGNTATTSDATFTTNASVLAPTISNITVSNITTTGATVSWQTDLAADSTVLYGTTTAYGTTVTNATATTSHALALTGLSEGTLYHFAVRSTNVGGTTTSSDQTFVTQSTSSSTPLALNSVDTVQGNATADDTFVHGWQWVMHLTVPDNENAFRMKFSDFTGSAGTIPAASNIRIFSPQSSNSTNEATATTMAAGNTYGGWIYLTGDTAALTPGRQIDVTIQVRVPSGTAAGSYTTTYGAQSVPQAATSTTP